VKKRPINALDAKMAAPPSGVTQFLNMQLVKVAVEEMDWQHPTACISKQ
jgi:hypothetical protein